MSNVLTLLTKTPPRLQPITAVILSKTKQRKCFVFHRGTKSTIILRSRIKITQIGKTSMWPVLWKLYSPLH